MHGGTSAGVGHILKRCRQSGERTTKGRTGTGVRRERPDFARTRETHSRAALGFTANVKRIEGIVVCRAPFRVVRGCGMATKVQRRAGRAKVSSSAFALDPPSLYQPKPASTLSGQARGEQERLWGQGTRRRDALGREVEAHSGAKEVTACPGAKVSAWAAAHPRNRTLRRVRLHPGVIRTRLGRCGADLTCVSTTIPVFSTSAEGSPTACAANAALIWTPRKKSAACAGAREAPHSRRSVGAVPNLGREKRCWGDDEPMRSI